MRVAKVDEIQVKLILERWYGRYIIAIANVTRYELHHIFLELNEYYTKVLLL